MRPRPSVLPAVAALLASCSALEYDPPPSFELPPMAAEPVDLRQWWLQFADASLVEVVERTLAYNHDLHAAAARVAEAAALTGAVDDLLPDATLAATAGRDQTSDRNAFPRFAGIDRRNSFHRVRLDVTWELDLWGRIRAQGDAAMADLLASDAQRDGLRAALAAQAAQTYLRLVATDLQIALSEATLQNRQAALDVVRRRLEGGTANELEVHQAEAELEAVAATLPLLAAARDNAARAVLVLTGESPEAIADGVVERGPALPAPPAVPEGLPSDLLARRPDVRAAEASLLGAQARVVEARARYFPTISLTGAVGQESEQLADLFTAPATIWSFAGGLLQPLTDLRQIDARAGAAAARRQQAEADYARTVQTAFAEVYEALALRTANRDTVTVQDRHIRALENAERVATVRHDAGVGTFLDLLIAQRNLLTVRSARIDTATAELLATIDVYRALGGGWDPEAPMLATGDADAASR